MKRRNTEEESDYVPPKKKKKVNAEKPSGGRNRSFKGILRQLWDMYLQNKSIEQIANALDREPWQVEKQLARIEKKRAQNPETFELFRQSDVEHLKWCWASQKWMIQMHSTFIGRVKKKSDAIILINLMREELNSRDSDIILPYVNDQAPDHGHPDVKRIAKQFPIKKKCDIIGNKRSIPVKKKKPLVKEELCGTIEKVVRKKTPSRKSSENMRLSRDQRNTREVKRKAAIPRKNLRRKAVGGAKSRKQKSIRIHVGTIPIRRFPVKTPVLDVFSASSDEDSDTTSSEEIVFPTSSKRTKRSDTRQKLASKAVSSKTAILDGVRDLAVTIPDANSAVTSTSQEMVWIAEGSSSDSSPASDDDCAVQ